MIAVDPLIFKAICVFLGPLWCILIMRLGFGVFDRITPFKTSTELFEANLAVGVVVGCIFIGLGICTGLVVGLSLF